MHPFIFPRSQQGCKRSSWRGSLNLQPQCS